MPTKTSKKEVEINPTLVELEQLKKRISESETLVITLALDTLTGRGSLAIGQLPQGHEIEALNLIISGLEQVLKVQRDNLLMLMSDVKAKELASASKEPVPASANGSKEPTK